MSCDCEKNEKECIEKVEVKNCDCKCNSTCPEEERCKCGCDDFIYVYNTVTELIPAGAAITFNNPPVPLIGDGLFYTSSQNFITVTEPGVYRFEYILSDITVASTFALFLNGVEIPGSRYQATVGVELVGQGIFTTTCNDVPGMIQLINVGTATADVVVGIFSNTVNISLLINRIN